MTKTSSLGARDAACASKLVRAALLPVLLLGVARTMAAQEPASDALPRARIALINANLLFSESLLGKRYSARIQGLQKEIQSARQAKEAEAAKRSAELGALKNELQQHGDLLSPEARDNKALEIRRRERDLQAFIDDGRSEIQRLQQRVEQDTQKLHDEYRGKMRPYIEAVAREKEIDFLIDAAVALPLNPRYDISMDVIARADAAEQGGKTEP
jgi:Skp family chaperone for outer membrane proteins